MGQGYFFYHVSMAQGPLANLFWKARGFNGTGADGFMAVGLSPRWFS